MTSTEKCQGRSDEGQYTVGEKVIVDFPEEISINRRVCQKIAVGEWWYRLRPEVEWRTWANIFGKWENEESSLYLD